MFLCSLVMIFAIQGHPYLDTYMLKHYIHTTYPHAHPEKLVSFPNLPASIVRHPWVKVNTCINQVLPAKLMIFLPRP